MQKRELLQSKNTFCKLDYYRHTLNELLRLADCTEYVCGELMKHTDEIFGQKEDAIVDDAPTHGVQHSPSNVSTFYTFAASRKRNRLSHLNSRVGQAPGTEVKNHQHCTTRTAYYCALWGLHRDLLGRRRSCIKCVPCKVNFSCKNSS